MITNMFLDVCFVDGRYYNSGEIIVKTNPCEMCRCFYGHPLCQVQQCPAPPQPSCVLEYLPGYCCPRVTCGTLTISFKPLIKILACMLKEVERKRTLKLHSIFESKKISY